ncbi:hypothetical protein TB2_042759 [Malus domestica]
MSPERAPEQTMPEQWHLRLGDRRPQGRSDTRRADQDRCAQVLAMKRATGLLATGLGRLDRQPQLERPKDQTLQSYWRGEL